MVGAFTPGLVSPTSLYLESRKKGKSRIMASLFISSLVSQLLFDYDNFNSAFGKLPIDHPQDYAQFY